MQYASCAKVYGLLDVSYRNSLIRILGTSPTSRKLPGCSISLNRTSSRSGARSVTVTAREEQAARLLFTMASRIILRKPREYSGDKCWQWGFPRVYWFQEGSKSKGKGGVGFHSNKLVDFTPPVYCEANPQARNMPPHARNCPQVDFRSINLLDLVSEFEGLDGWARQP